MGRLIISGRICFCAILLAGLIVALAGCAAHHIPSVDTGAGNEPAYASEIADTMLKAIDSKDYASFSDHFDDNMRETLTETAFAGLHNLTSSRAGRYLSKQFLNSTRFEDYLEVLYRAEYSMENVDMEVRIVFQEAGENIYVAGFWMNSPVFMQ